MTLGDLLGRLYERLSYQSTPAAAVTTRLTNLLNDAQRRILRTPGLERLRPTTTGLTFASVAAQTIYGLPPVLASVRTITDRTNNRLLTSLSLDELRGTDPGLTASGTPSAYVFFGFKPYAQPPVSTGLWAVSSSAADTGGPKVQINGIRSGGIVTGDVEASLTGITRVAIGSFTDYVDLQSIALSAACAGVVSIYDAASNGNLIAQIQIGKLTAEYLSIQLYPTPATAITYYVDGVEKSPDMDDSYDSPVLPEDFHEMLVPAALCIEYEKNDDPRLQLAQMLYQRDLSQLKYWVASQGETHVFGRAPSARFSRLGSWTPAD